MHSHRCCSSLRIFARKKILPGCNRHRPVVRERTTPPYPSRQARAGGAGEKVDENCHRPQDSTSAAADSASTAEINSVGRPAGVPRGVHRRWLGAIARFLPSPARTTSMEAASLQHFLLAVIRLV